MLKEHADYPALMQNAMHAKGDNVTLVGNADDDMDRMLLNSPEVLHEVAKE